MLGKEGARFFVEAHEQDWIQTNSIDRLDAISRRFLGSKYLELLGVLILPLSIGLELWLTRFQLPFKRTTQHMDYFDDEVLRVVLARAVLTTLVGLFFIIPGALQRLGVTNGTGDVICLVSFLLAFVLLAGAMTKDVATIVMLTIAFGAVLASMIFR